MEMEATITDEFIWALYCALDDDVTLAVFDSARRADLHRRIPEITSDTTYVVVRDPSNATKSLYASYFELDEFRPATIGLVAGRSMLHSLARGYSSALVSLLALLVFRGVDLSLLYPTGNIYGLIALATNRPRRPIHVSATAARILAPGEFKYVIDLDYDVDADVFYDPDHAIIFGRGLADATRVLVADKRWKRFFDTDGDRALWCSIAWMIDF